MISILLPADPDVAAALEEEARLLVATLELNLTAGFSSPAVLAGDVFLLARKTNTH